MEKIRVLMLGTRCRDKASGLMGTLTHLVLNMGRQVAYVFQPRGLDEDCQPMAHIALEEDRFEVVEDMFERIDVPTEVLGTQVVDEASGFTGMATRFVRHLNGCFHVEIQPAGVVPKTGKPIRCRDFDLRGCTGEMIKPLTQPELAESKKERPSPVDTPYAVGLPASLGL
jgi:hypothetical protein